MKTRMLLGKRVEIAETFLERTRGLIGHKPLAPEEGMLILKCNCIHTCFMRFPIDAIFLDKENRIVKVVKSIRPGRLFVWGGFRACKVLEVAAESGVNCE